MKTIIINTPDGQYSLELRKVAEHRANYYRGKEKYSMEEWQAEVDWVMSDDFEGIDWLLNSSNYEDWEDVTVKLNDEVKVLADDFWTSSGDFEIAPF